MKTDTLFGPDVACAAHKYECAAGLSPCGLYRFWLTRCWAPAKPCALFIMLNPSTADHEQDDATIRKCIGFARRWGMGSIRVANLFAYRATKPDDLKRADNPIGGLSTEIQIEMAGGAA